MVKSAVHDVEVFLKDTHLQIKHKLDNGFHVSVERVVKDLEGLWDWLSIKVEVHVLQFTFFLYFPILKMLTFSLASQFKRKYLHILA